MVRIAVAGGSGNVGQEVVDAILTLPGNEHEVLVLSRKDAPPDTPESDVKWAKVDYGIPEQLEKALEGVDTVLSFIVTHADPGNAAQKNLIDAAVKARVRRFAPSEWVSPTFDHMPWNAGKVEIRRYLEKVNSDRKVLEYTLFHPGLLTNYLTYPHKSAKHVQPIATPFDLDNRRALILDGSEDARITLTTAQDLANVVARAVNHKGEWPLVSGVQGDELTIGQVIALGEKARGGPFNVERLKAADLQAGVTKSSWTPGVEHPAFSSKQAEALASSLTVGIIMGISTGVLNVSNEWNKLLPDYMFTKAEEFLVDFWRDKP